MMCVPFGRRVSWVLAVLLAGLVVVGAGCGAPAPDRTSPAEVVLAEAPAEMPLVLLGPLPAVTGHDGIYPYSLVVDTGSAVTVLDPGLVGRTDLPTREARWAVRDWSGAVQWAQQAAIVPSMTVGDAEFRDFDAVVTDLGSLRTVLGDSLQGVLGLSMFREVVLTIDYPRRTLLLRPHPVAPAEGEVELPLRIDRDGLPLVPVQVGERTIWAILDTGAGTTLALPPEMLPPNSPRLRVGYAAVPSGTQRVPIVSLPVEVTFAGRTWPAGMPVVVSPYPAPTLGSSLLADSVLTIDQRAGVVRIRWSQ